MFRTIPRWRAGGRKPPDDPGERQETLPLIAAFVIHAMIEHLRLIDVVLMHGSRDSESGNIVESHSIGLKCFSEHGQRTRMVFDPLQAELEAEIGGGRKRPVMTMARSVMLTVLRPMPGRPPVE